MLVLSNSVKCFSNGISDISSITSSTVVKKPSCKERIRPKASFFCSSLRQYPALFSSLAKIMGASSDKSSSSIDFDGGTGQWVLIIVLALAISVERFGSKTFSIASIALFIATKSSK